MANYGPRLGPRPYIPANPILEEMKAETHSLQKSYDI